MWLRVHPEDAQRDTPQAHVDVLMGGHAPARHIGSFGRREGLQSATTAEWKKNVRQVDDVLSLRTPEELWELFRAAGKFGDAVGDLLVHMRTLRPVGAELFQVCVTDAGQLLLDASHSRMVLINREIRWTLLLRAGFVKKQRPLRRPAIDAIAAEPPVPRSAPSAAANWDRGKIDGSLCPVHWR